MDWIEGQLDDESIFPQKLGIPFPPNFRDIKIVSLKEEAHLNTSISSCLHVNLD
ncbi:hypothetical protein MKX01_031038 [Papaver californicum]|nr:hypothetical protein MKX01_031038 [Papaver californicum]